MSKLFQVNKKEDGKIEVLVHIAYFKDKYKKELLSQQKDIVIPGFRKGKAPVVLVEKFLGKELLTCKVSHDVITDVSIYLLEQDIQVNNYTHYPKAEALLENFDFSNKFFSILFVPKIS